MERRRRCGYLLRPTSGTAASLASLLINNLVSIEEDMSGCFLSDDVVWVRTEHVSVSMEKNYGGL